MENVERLRQLIQNGNYKVDSQKMADNLLATSVNFVDDEWAIKLNRLLEDNFPWVSLLYEVTS